MKTVLIAISLFLSASAFASQPEIACYGVSQGEGFGFVIQSTENTPFTGVLFPTIDPGDQGEFTCTKQNSGIVCRNIHDYAWHVRIENTPHGNWATVYTEELESTLSQMMSLDCRPR